MDPVTVAMIAAGGSKLLGSLFQGIGQKRQHAFSTAMAKSQGLVQAAGMRTQAAGSRLQAQQSMTVGATNVANIQSAVGRDVAALRAQAARLGVQGGSSYDVIRDVMQQAARQQEDTLLGAMRERNALEAQATMSGIQAQYTQSTAKYAAGPKPSMWMTLLGGAVEGGAAAAGIWAQSKM